MFLCHVLLFIIINLFCFLEDFFPQKFLIKLLSHLFSLSGKTLKSTHLILSVVTVVPVHTRKPGEGPG